MKFCRDGVTAASAMGVATVARVAAAAKVPAASLATCALGCCAWARTARRATGRTALVALDATGAEERTRRDMAILFYASVVQPRGCERQYQGREGDGSA